MQGTGYSDDEDSVRVADLDGVASVAARSSEALDASVGNAFVSTADEALDDWDRLLSMPTDATLSTAQRQARLVAWMSALPKLIEARLDHALDAWLGTTSGVTLAPNRSVTWRSGGHKLGSLAVGRLETGATIATMRVIDALLRRGLPARAIGCKGATRYADYGSPVERSAFRVSIPATPFFADADTAPLEQFPGGVLTEESYKEMQAQLLWKPYRGNTGTMTNHFSLDHESSPGAMLYAAGSLTALTTVALEDSGTVDGAQWGSRVVQAWIVVSTSAITDTTALSGHGWLSAVKLGDSGSAPFPHLFVPLAGGAAAANMELSLSANALTLTNNHATNTYYFKLFVRRTPKCFADTTHSREPWLEPTTTLDADAVTAMVSESRIRNPTIGTYADLISPGSAVRRILYTGAMQRTAAGDTPNVVVLDSSIDWRGRALLVTHLVDSSTVVKEASSTKLTGRMIEDSSGSPSGLPLTKIFLTGTGSAANPTTTTAFQYICYTGTDADIWLWADSTTGYLKAEMKASLSDHEYACGFIMVTATPLLGTPAVALPSLPSAYPQALSVDFTVPQLHGCYAQGQAGATSAVTAPPLGTIVDGALPARPISWLVRERAGHIYDRKIDVRQRIYGQRKRLISFAVGSGAVMDIDACSVLPEASTSTLDQIDYRDRFVFIEGEWAASDISLGKALPGIDDPVVRFSWVFYGGPYGDQSITLPGSGSGMVITFIFGRNGNDAFQSRLSITNNDGGTRYLNLAIECTGFLGLTDRRLDGAAS
jgi:hypothetical protein